MDPLELPREVQDAVDRVLRPVASSRQTTAALQVIQTWCEENPDECGLWEGDDDQFRGLQADSFHGQVLFSDESLRDYEGLEDNVPITDKDRINFMEAKVRDLLEDGNGDADYIPVFRTIPIRARSGKEAVLGYGIRGYSFSGVELDWYGVFKDADDFRRCLQADGWITSLDEFVARSEPNKLKLWNT